MTADRRSPGRSLGVERGEFLGRISRALGRSAAQAPATVPLAEDALLRRVDPGDDLARVFTERARGAGMAVVAETSRAGLADVVEAARVRHGADRVAVSIGDAELHRLVAEALGDRVLDADGPFDALFDTTLGVTDVAAAIAESGSFVIAPGPGRGRGPGLVPARHLAIVPRQAIVADLLDWLRGGLGGALPAASIVVTGPSKTADIEGNLVTGVHGPGIVEIVVVD